MFIEELVSLLQEAPSIGTYGSTIFASSRMTVPAGANAYLTIVETSGPTPERTHNSISIPAYPRPGAQLTARAEMYGPARILARSAAFKLGRVRNRFVESLPMAIVSLTRVGTEAIVTVAAPGHGLASGFQIVVSGAAQAAYNGTHEITVLSLTTFSFPVVGSPVTPATGAVVRQRCWYREIDVQDPFDMGPDSSGRVRSVFNLSVVKRPS